MVMTSWPSFREPYFAWDHLGEPLFQQDQGRKNDGRPLKCPIPRKWEDGGECSNLFGLSYSGIKFSQQSVRVVIKYGCSLLIVICLTIPTSEMECWRLSPMKVNYFMNYLEELGVMKKTSSFTPKNANNSRLYLEVCV